MASFICHVVGVAKRVRLERFVRRDHPAEVKRPQGRLDRSLENQARPANYQQRTFRSRTHWADNGSAATRRIQQPKPASEPMCCLSARAEKCPKPALRSPRQLGSNGHQVKPKPRTALALALTRLTLELSRPAKRVRLE